jgi:hypothetical protein
MARLSPPRPSPPAEPPVAFVAFRDRLLLPDFTGLTRSEVTSITAGGGVHVRFRGTGRAIRQDPPPGTVVPNGDIVSIELQERLLPETTPGDRAVRALSAIGGPT